MLDLFAATVRILADEAGTSIDPAHLPFQPACFVLCPLLVLALVKGIFEN